MSHAYEQFLTTVQHGAAISRAEAERATQATLQTLAERLARGEARDLAAQLDPGIGPWLFTDTDAEGFDLDEFLHRVAERSGVPPEGALKDARAVLLALRRTVSQDELEDMTAELPAELRALIAGADLPPSAELILSAAAARAALDPGDARRAVSAVLETLAERIAGGEVDDLMRELPPDLHPPLRTGKALSGGKATRMRLETFLERVAEREGVTVDAARDHARAVFATLREVISAEEFLDITAQLPEEYAAVGAQP
jgi:uncharacterized protein (DUF2267 family)